MDMKTRKIIADALLKAAARLATGRKIKAGGEHVEVAQTILQQLGGRRVKAMTGAKNFVALKDKMGGLQFQFPNPHGGPNSVRIILNGMDEYEVEFFRGTKSVKSVDRVYAEDLIDLFEKTTGLYLRL